jgi:Na+/proline symporter
MAFGAYFTGALTHLFYPKFPASLVNAGVKNFDGLMPLFITDPVIGLPHWLVLIILLMIFSASMSSLSSLVLVSSSAISVDIYKACAPKASQGTTMTLMRVLCAVFVACSLLIAMSKFDVIVNLMVIAWGTLAGTFLAPYLYGLFWKRTTTAGAFVGMLSGLVVSVVLFILWGKPNIPVAGAVAMIVPLLVTPIVSLLTPPPPQALVDAAFTDAPAAESPSEEGVPA